jgi:M6 family metalloprotease-like protein
MNRALLLLLAAAWLAFALSGYVVGYVVDYENGSSATYFFLMLDNGTLIPLVEPPPHYLVGTGERVEAEIVYTEVGVGARVSAPREPTQAIPRQPVSGPLLVTLVAAKFADVSFEPYNMSYVHDVVFGPFPSMRHFWESASGGALIIRPYYIHWGWISLPRTKADYCNTGNDFSQIAIDVINILYSRGVRLPSYSYLVVVLNDVLPCNSAAGRGTIRFWSFNTPYGTIWLAVSQIYHYADVLRENPDVHAFAHEFGHNLGLHHSGAPSAGGNDPPTYDNYWDVMGGFGPWRRLNSWLGVTYYGLPNGLALPHLYFLGWGSFVGSGVGAWLLGSRSGVYIPASDGVYTVEYKCAGAYEQYLDWCGVVVHKVLNIPDASGRWVYFQHIFNVTSPPSFTSNVNFLDVGQSAWVAGVRVSVLWRNLTHARIVVGLPTLADVVGANATFVVGSRAAAIDSVAAVYARTAFSPTATYTLPGGRLLFNPIFAYLDSEQWLAQMRYWYNRLLDRLQIFAVQYPGVVVSVGGPLANSLTWALNPPDRLGAGGLPFYFDTTVGGIKDAGSGQVWRSRAAVVAVVPNGSRVYVLVWGIGGEDTRRAARWLAECMPPRAYAVVINTTDFRVLASWPSGSVGSSVCPGAVYTAAAVVGANAASIDAVGAAMAAGGLGLLDSEVAFGSLPPYVFSVGGPLANSFTRLYNPPNGPGFGGLPFYYNISRGGIMDGRTRALLCTSNCFVVAKLIDRGKAVVLAWGIGGHDTRAAAAYLHYHGRTLLDSRSNTARVVSWSYLSRDGYRYGLDFRTLATWP